jgi:hypothetical protein
MRAVGSQRRAVALLVIDSTVSGVNDTMAMPPAMLPAAFHVDGDPAAAGDLWRAPAAMNSAPVPSSTLREGAMIARRVLDVSRADAEQRRQRDSDRCRSAWRRTRETVRSPTG